MSAERRVRLLAFLAFLGLTLFLYDRFVLAGLNRSFLGMTFANFSYQAWMLKWWSYCILHLQNPFHTQMIFYPEGTYLSWDALFMPALGILCFPVTVLFGPVVAMNLVLILEPTLAGYFWFRVINRFVPDRFAAFIGGCLFAFSSYTLDEALQSLANTMAVALVPLVLLLMVNHFDGKLSGRAFIAGIAATFAVIFGIFPEIFASAILFFGTLAVVGYVCFPDRRILGLIVRTAVGVALSVLVILPLLIHMLVVHYYSGETYGLSRADLLSFIVPDKFVPFLSAYFRELYPFFSTYGRKTYGPWSISAYMGLPLIVVTFVYIVRTFERRTTKVLFAMLMIFFVLALGRPTLLIAGVSTIPLPWDLVRNVPLLRNLQPHRLTAYIFLISSLIAALCLATQRPPRKVLIALLIVLFLFPYRFGGRIGPGDVIPRAVIAKVAPASRPILVVSSSYGMMEQIRANFAFRNVDAFGPGQDTAPVYHYELWKILYYKHFDQRELAWMVAFLKSKNVPAMIIARNFATPRLVAGLARLGLHPTSMDGALVYRIPGS